jgi:hypothetical protein
MKRRTFLIAALAVAGCTDAAAPPQLVPPDFAAAKPTGSGGATTLPTFGGGATAEAINDAGVVVGRASERNPSRDVAGVSYPVKWARNSAGAWQVTKLGAPGGNPIALNEAGDAVGLRSPNAVIWLASGEEVSLGTGVAEGINNARIIVGGAVWGNSPVAYVWTPNPGIPTTWTRHELPPLEEGGLAEAIAINNHSAIAGAATRGGLWRAVVWLPVDGGGWSAPIAREGTEPSTGTSAGFAINDNGDVAGYSRSCPPQTCGSRPYLWPVGGGSIDLATSLSNVNGSLAYGIANEGRVVGFANVTRGAGDGPFAWNPVGPTLTDLGSGIANDINNRTARYGQEAVGYSHSSKGQSAMLWRIQ